MNSIKRKMVELIESGLVKGHFEGPKENVLVTDTLNDFVLASGEMVKAGFFAASPGGYGGGNPESRQVTHQKIWRDGKLAAISHHRKVFYFFGLLSVDEEYEDVVCEMK